MAESNELKERRAERGHVTFCLIYFFIFVIYVGRRSSEMGFKLQKVQDPCNKLQHKTEITEFSQQMYETFH